MAHRIKILVTSAIAAVVVIGLLALRARNRAHAPESSVGETRSLIVDKAPATDYQRAPADIAVAAQSQSPEPTANQPKELEATHRMYIAHASLRVHEIADPDSEANRRILETMIKKALADGTVSVPAPGVPSK